MRSFLPWRSQRVSVVHVVLRQWCPLARQNTFFLSRSAIHLLPFCRFLKRFLVIISAFWQLLILSIFCAVAVFPPPVTPTYKWCSCTDWCELPGKRVL